LSLPIISIKSEFLALTILNEIAIEIVFVALPRTDSIGPKINSRIVDGG